MTKLLNVKVKLQYRDKCTEVRIDCKQSSNFDIYPYINVENGKIKFENFKSNRVLVPLRTEIIPIIIHRINHLKMKLKLTQL